MRTTKTPAPSALHINTITNFKICGPLIIFHQDDGTMAFSKYRTDALAEAREVVDLLEQAELEESAGIDVEGKTASSKRPKHQFGAWERHLRTSKSSRKYANAKLIMDMPYCEIIRNGKSAMAYVSVPTSTGIHTSAVPIEVYSKYHQLVGYTLDEFARGSDNVVQLRSD